MPYRVRFESNSAEELTREVLDLLRSFSLEVTSTGEVSEGAPQGVRVTLGERAGDFAHGLPGRWIAIIPRASGSVEDFEQAGAYAAIKLPAERSIVLAAISRCLSLTDDMPPCTAVHRARRPARYV